jgi:hypothetical protein
MAQFIAAAGHIVNTGLDFGLDLYIPIIISLETTKRSSIGLIE